MNDEEWNRITKALFTSKPAAPSEAFVENVMARIAEPVPAFWWMAARWLLPVAGVTAALLFFSPASEEPVPVTENLLIADSGNLVPSPWAFPEDEPPAEALPQIEKETL